MLLRRGRVVVEQVDALGFQVRTLRLHPDAGTSAFRVQLGREPGGVTLQVESVVRARSRFNRLAYLLGIHIAQRRTWELTLASVARVTGGRVVGQGHESLELPLLIPTDRLPEMPVGRSAP